MSGVRAPQHPPVSCKRRKCSSRSPVHGVVVQLVRIPACHAGGRGFESRPLRQSSKKPRGIAGLFAFESGRVPSAISLHRNGVHAAFACAGLQTKPGIHLRQSSKKPRGIAGLFAFESGRVSSAISLDRTGVHAAFAIVAAQLARLAGET